KPDVLAASSFGAGELIRHAIGGGAGRIIVGVGGTAASDGGEGLQLALGSVPDGIELVAALDVDNPLLGPAGAAAVYGPQKGATTPQLVAQLERPPAARGAARGEPRRDGAGGGDQ